MNYLTNGYKLAEPVLAGHFFGMLQTAWADKSITENANVSFAIGTALTVLTSTALPCSLRAKGLIALGLGTAAYLSHRYEWVKANKMRLITLATLASSAFELYKGQRAYPLAKIAGTLFAQVDAYLDSKGRKWEKTKTILFQAQVCFAILPFAVGSLIQGGAFAYGKFAKLNRNPQIAIGIALGVIAASALFTARKPAAPVVRPA